LLRGGETNSKSKSLLRGVGSLSSPPNGVTGNALSGARGTAPPRPGGAASRYLDNPIAEALGSDIEFEFECDFGSRAVVPVPIAVAVTVALAVSNEGEGLILCLDKRAFARGDEGGVDKSPDLSETDALVPDPDRLRPGPGPGPGWRFRRASASDELGFAFPFQPLRIPFDCPLLPDIAPGGDPDPDPEFKLRRFGEDVDL